MAVFPAEQTTRTNFYYRAAYADYAALLSYRGIYAARTSSCSRNLPLHVYMLLLSYTQQAYRLHG